MGHDKPINKDIDNLDFFRLDKDTIYINKVYGNINNICKSGNLRNFINYIQKNEKASLVKLYDISKNFNYALRKY